MQKQIDERTCDYCKKVVQQSEMQFGGSPFNGWFRVEKTDGSTKLPLPDTGPWDFCCVNCLTNFLSGKPAVEDPHAQIRRWGAERLSVQEALEVLKQGVADMERPPVDADDGDDGI